MSSTVDFMGVEEDKTNSAAAESLKKLEELTDEDVRQLTREDCRRYLKDKESAGMRRPSWNKAQALQQVLSLKSLCHPFDVAAAGEQVAAADPAASKKRAVEMGASIHLTAAVVTATAGNSQLTMFYDGSVSVFDDVSLDKAHAIMLLAENTNSWPSISALAATTKPSRSVVSSRELPQARKASLHRFLQRRRETMEAKKSPPGVAESAEKKHVSNDPIVEGSHPERELSS